MTATATAMYFATALITHSALGWIPAGQYEYTTTPCSVERGPFGNDPVFIARRRKAAGGYEYAIIVVASRKCVRDIRDLDHAIVDDVRNPTLDTAAVLSVAKWRTRKGAASDLSTF